MSHYRKPHYFVAFLYLAFCGVILFSGFVLLMIILKITGVY